MAKVVGTMYEPYDCGSVNCFPNGIRPSYDAVPAPVTRPTWKDSQRLLPPRAPPGPQCKHTCSLHKC